MPAPIAVPNPIPKRDPKAPKCLYPIEPKEPIIANVVLNYLHDMI